MRERGTAMIEMIVFGFVAVALIVPTVTTIVRLCDAHAIAGVAAHDGASWYARHGRPAPDDRSTVDVEYVADGDSIEATAVIDVSVVDVAGLSMTLTVVERAVAPISPYRSGQ